MKAIKIKDFNEAVEIMEFLFDWDYVESEDGDMRFDYENDSIWVRQGTIPMIEGYMNDDMAKFILKNVPDSEIY